ncbi:hypothetical protein AMECASPLE_030582 [Ameca splendens]|uniref:Uncharacterized protein n=1 Tax=Ameca splendens TaxID=208324 RepID=A0ABV0Y651_9TELE
MVSSLPSFSMGSGLLPNLAVDLQTGFSEGPLCSTANLQCTFSAAVDLQGYCTSVIAQLPGRVLRGFPMHCHHSGPTDLLLSRCGFGSDQSADKSLAGSSL